MIELATRLGQFPTDETTVPTTAGRQGPANQCTSDGTTVPTTRPANQFTTGRTIMPKIVV